MEKEKYNADNMEANLEGSQETTKPKHLKIFAGVVIGFVLVAFLSTMSLSLPGSSSNTSSSDPIPIGDPPADVADVAADNNDIDLGFINSVGDHYNVASDENLPAELVNRSGDITFMVTDENVARNNPVVVWDWGSVDGDVVQVNFQQIPLTHAKQPIPVATERNIDIEVLGVTDGTGGITVGVSAPGCTPSVNIMTLQPGQTHKIRIR